ncbi:MAG: hypothetical protein ACLPKE_23955 [Streptosporangiaceae bacterium]
MRPIRAVLIDIDGVLTVSWKPLPGAVAALQRLRAAAFPLALVTNTTSRTRASIASALAEAAFPVSVGDILTAPVLAAAYLQDHYPGARCLLLSSGDIGQDLAGHYGVQLWTPEAGGRVDYASEHDEKTMTMLGLSSKREITRTSIRVRAAMAVQPGSRAGTWAGARRTGTGSLMPGRTRTRRTPRGADGRTAWNPTRGPRRRCGGSSRSGWPGTRSRGSRER